MAINTNAKKIREVLSRGVDKVIDKKHLEKQLRSGKKLCVYYGIDPTSPQLHLGHSVVLWKLRGLQELGHEVILLIGDFTARIGDPTDKMAARKPLTEAQVKANMKTYRQQAGKILNFSKVKLKYNSQWLARLNFVKIAEIASHLSVQRMLERDMFEKRLKQGKTISLQEFLYPLMQGYDSVAMNVDLEIAGSDQLFNMLAGRKLQKIYNKKDKDVLTTKLLSGTDGRKMSKTFGNFIALSAEPNEMYGKLMSMKDELIEEYFELCARLPAPMAEIKRNPRLAKAKLAREIVKMYHSQSAASKAEKEFNKVFRDRGAPSKIAEFKTKKKTYSILDLLNDSGLASSKSEAKRLVLAKGVKIDNKLKTDWQEKLKLKNGSVLKVGKRKFIKIKI